uniref:Uncharacterized protein n=1 Tax=Anopheles maculatus TaxID=74869 RepID=A0A182SDF9_9DIPT
SKLLFGTYEDASVAIHAVPLGHLRAFYNPQSQSQSFTHNQTSRKSFSRGSGKVRLSIGAGGSNGGGSAGLSSDAGQDGEGGSGNGGGMSPNLNIEMIDEEDAATYGSAFEFDLPPAKGTLDELGNGRMAVGGSNVALSFPAGPVETVMVPSAGPLINNHYLVREEMQMYNLNNLDYYPLPKGIVPEVEKEDFPVKNAQPPDYAPKSASQPVSGGSSSTYVNGNAGGNGASGGSGKNGATGVSGRTAGGVRSMASTASDQRRPGSVHGGVGHSRSAGNLVRRLATSKSTLELNKLHADDAVTFKKPISRGSSPIRHQSHQPPYHTSGTGSSSSKIQRSESNAQIANLRNGTNGGPDRTRQHNANVKVQIVTKPVRSKTSLDIRHHGHRSATSGPTSGMYGQRVASGISPAAQDDALADYGSGSSNMGALMLDQPSHGPTILRYDNSSLEYEIQMLRNE